MAERADLEEAFLSLTADNGPGDAPPGSLLDAVLPVQTGAGE
jgi:hypothetical protein